MLTLILDPTFPMMQLDSVYLLAGKELFMQKQSSSPSSMSIQCPVELYSKTQLQHSAFQPRKHETAPHSSVDVSQSQNVFTAFFKLQS